MSIDCMSNLPPAWGKPEIPDFKSLKINNMNNEDNLRIFHLVAFILGYIPLISRISGVVRMIFGVCCYYVIASSNLKNQELLLRRSLCHIIRGSLEAFVPFALKINIIMDIGTIISNLFENENVRI